MTTQEGNLGEFCLAFADSVLKNFDTILAKIIGIDASVQQLEPLILPCDQILYLKKLINGGRCESPFQTTAGIVP